MQQQILRLFQTVLDASITDVDFSIRVQAYEQAPSLQKFDFQPMKISFEFVGEKQFAEVLYPQSIYDLIDFSLRKCVQEKIMMRTCKTAANILPSPFTAARSIAAGSSTAAAAPARKSARCGSMCKVTRRTSF